MSGEKAEPANTTTSVFVPSLDLLAFLRACEVFLPRQYKNAPVPKKATVTVTATRCLEIKPADHLRNPTCCRVGGGGGGGGSSCS